MRLLTLLLVLVCLAAPAEPVRVGAAVQAAKLVRRVEPPYPPLARYGNIEGDVRFKAEIAKDGTVRTLELEGGHPLLIPAAKDAVMQWRYSPTLLNGEPTAVSTIIVVTFKLRDSSGAAPPARIRVGGNVQAEKLIHRIEPVCPREARKRHTQGAVRFNALLRVDGRVERLDLAGGHPLLAEAAHAAVVQWRYAPTLLNGLPVEVETVIEVMVLP